METKNFLIIQEERSTKSPIVLWSVYKLIKKVSLVQQTKGILANLNINLISKHSGILKTDGPDLDIEIQRHLGVDAGMN